MSERDDGRDQLVDIIERRIAQARREGGADELEAAAAACTDTATSRWLYYRAAALRGDA